MQNITNVYVELIRQPKGQNWPTVDGSYMKKSSGRVGYWDPVRACPYCRALVAKNQNLQKHFCREIKSQPGSEEKFRYKTKSLMERTCFKSFNINFYFDLAFQHLLR